MKVGVGMHINNKKCCFIAERGTMRRLFIFRELSIIYLFISTNLFCIVSENHLCSQGVYVCVLKKEREVYKFDTIVIFLIEQKE